jgi:hypothetical protein
MSRRLAKTTSCLEEYAHHGTQQAELRHECVRRLAAKIAGQMQTFLDPMAGIGVDAQLLGAGADTLVNDIDPACLAILRQKFTRVSSYDFFNPPERTLLFASCQPDLIYLDFNTFTLAKWAKGEYRAEFDESFATAQKFLILNDCSNFGLKMWGKHRLFAIYSQIMGATIGSVDDYLASLPAFFKQHYPAWTLTEMESFFHASAKGSGGTAYLLFRKSSDG